MSRARVPRAAPRALIRSIVTRGSLDAEGCDTVLVETDGVRQRKVELARLTGGTIVVLVPGMGGGVQSMKAGIMEFAGVFVIGQPDRPCARGRASSTGGV